MDIKGFAKKLRNAAEVLEGLVLVDGTPALAQKIRESVAKRDTVTAPRKKYVHWTQRPENAKKLARMVRRSRAARQANGKA